MNVFEAVAAMRLYEKLYGKNLEQTIPTGKVAESVFSCWTPAGYLLGTCWLPVGYLLEPVEYLLEPRWIPAGLCQYKNMVLWINVATLGQHAKQSARWGVVWVCYKWYIIIQTEWRLCERIVTVTKQHVLMFWLTWCHVFIRKQIKECLWDKTVCAIKLIKTYARL